MQKFTLSLIFFLLVLSTGCTRQDFNIADNRDVEIGVLLRKQFTTDICEHRIYRHIHILLDGNEIMGYNTGVQPRPMFITYLLTHIPGEVRNYQDLIGIREHYINADVARDTVYHGKPGYRMVTDWVRFKVSREQADRLRAAWYEMRQNPPQFRLWGDNCASRLAENFVAAGILPPGLPGFDRPEAVLKQLRKYYPDLTLDTGYFGIDAEHNITFIPLDKECSAE